MEAKAINYEGFTITANPRQDEDSDLWTVDLVISRGTGDKKESWLISAGEQAELNEEAFQVCFDFGKEVIDREMKS